MAYEYDLTNGARRFPWLPVATSPHFGSVSIRMYFVILSISFPPVAGLLRSSGTWAMGPVCGLSNKQAMVRVVLQLMQRTVGANELHASQTVALEGER